ncbi:MAG: hypothetical protein ACE5K4_06685 [Candidatus Hydrothermarchaeota archaeon]
MKVTEEIREFIPKFSGYREKRKRKEADKLIKNEILKKLKEISLKIDRMSFEIRVRKLPLLKEMENLKEILYGFLNKIKETNYKKYGLFVPMKIDEGRLRLIYIYDLTIIKNLNSLLEEINLLENEVKLKEFKDLNKILSIKNSLLELKELFDRRESILMM